MSILLLTNTSLHALVCLLPFPGKRCWAVRTQVRPSRDPPAPGHRSLLQGPTCLVLYGMSTSNPCWKLTLEMAEEIPSHREQNQNSEPSTKYFYQCGLGVCHTLFLELNPQSMSCSASSHPTEAKSYPEPEVPSSQWYY